jgi:hypothetical protein
VADQVGDSDPREKVFVKTTVDNRKMVARQKLDSRLRRNDERSRNNACPRSPLPPFLIC